MGFSNLGLTVTLNFLLVNCAEFRCKSSYIVLLWLCKCAHFKVGQGAIHQFSRYANSNYMERPRIYTVPFTYKLQRLGAIRAKSGCNCLIGLYSCVNCCVNPRSSSAWGKGEKYWGYASVISAFLGSVNAKLSVVL